MRGGVEELEEWRRSEEDWHEYKGVNSGSF